MSDLNQTENRSRQHDFKFVLVLLVILIALFSVTLTFPMSGNYGGVENQWYVSPALFPLIILTALFLCSGTLLITISKQKGYQNFFNVGAWLGNRTEQAVLDRWLIIGLLIAYVYIFIPSVDFYLATTVFVISLTSIFYLKLPHVRKWVLMINSLLVFSLVILRLSFMENEDSSLLEVNSIDACIFYCDIIAGLSLACLIAWQIKWGLRENKAKVTHNLIAALVVPLLLIIVFSFLLYVPMPVEYGSVINLLNWIAYEQIGL